MASKSQNNPVWGVYDLYRTAKLNVKYYSIKLTRLNRLNLSFEIIIAVTASSSIGGLWFFSTGHGVHVWKILGAVAAFITVLKPILNLIKKINIYSELLAGYRSLEHDLYQIKELISLRGSYDEELKLEFKKSLQRKGVLVGKDPDSNYDKRLVNKLVEEVNKEVPLESLYIP